MREILMETAHQIESILTPLMRMEIKQGMREILMETAHQIEIYYLHL